ncbi:hypothetical protein GGX14DRAFT_564910 [Mycena pura]|uniref:DUF6699 domain-containing protein n=1 Tax=Mycena pura TaxID=153505 RepID=A0AAD6VGX9_9AGAR|nr:hypothetical protein GGX14DRAFT_564910 [Mycena pura]
MGRKPKGVPPGRTSDFTGEKLEWLMGFEDEFYARNHSDLYDDVTKQFLKRYGYDLQFNENVPGSIDDWEPVNRKAGLMDEELAAENDFQEKVYQDLCKKLGNWFRHRFTGKRLHSGALKTILSVDNLDRVVGGRPYDIIVGVSKFGFLFFLASLAPNFHFDLAASAFRPLRRVNATQSTLVAPVELAVTTLQYLHATPAVHIFHFVEPIFIVTSFSSLDTDPGTKVFDVDSGASHARHSCSSDASHYRHGARRGAVAASSPFTRRGPHGGRSQVQHVDSDPAVHKVHGRRVGATEGPALRPYTATPRSACRALRCAPRAVSLGDILITLHRLHEHVSVISHADWHALGANDERRWVRTTSGASPREAELALHSQGVKRVDLLQGKTLLKGLVCTKTILKTMQSMTGKNVYPRRKSNMAFYSNKYYATKMKADFDMIWHNVKDTLPVSACIGMCQDHVKSCWDKESEDFKASVKKEAEADYQAALKEFRERLVLPEKTAEEYHSTLKNFDEVGIPLADALAERLGIHIAILAVGPVGEQGGEVRVRSVFSDTSTGKTSKMWPEFDRSGFTAAEASLSRYGRALFSKQSCRERVWPTLDISVPDFDGLFTVEPAGAPTSATTPSGATQSTSNVATSTSNVAATARQCSPKG